MKNLGPDSILTSGNLYLILLRLCRRFDDLISESFLQDQRYLKYRSFILRICANALYLAEEIYPPREVNGNAMKNGTSNKSDLLVSMLENLLVKFKEHHESVIKSENNYKALEKYINGPDRSRLTFYVLGNHYELLIHLVNAVLEAHKHSHGEGAMEKPLEDASALLSQMTDNLIGTCQPNPKKSIKQREEEMEKMVNLLEVS